MSELNTCQTRTFVIRKIFFKFDCLKTFPDKGSCDLLKKVCARLVSLCSTFMGLWDTNKQTDKLSITIFPRVGKCIEGNYLIRTCWPPTPPSTALNSLTLHLCANKISEMDIARCTLQQEKVKCM